MKTIDDRELLELAARAAGLTEHRYCGPWKATAQYDEVESGFFGRSWDPLTDDGDALRLAVGLGINVNFGNQEEGAVVAFDFSGRFQDCEESGEPRAAYRRAVVRAAAEIGKGMP